MVGINTTRSQTLVLRLQQASSRSLTPKRSEAKRSEAKSRDDHMRRIGGSSYLLSEGGGGGGGSPAAAAAAASHRWRTSGPPSPKDGGDEVVELRGASPKPQGSGETNHDAAQGWFLTRESFQSMTGMAPLVIRLGSSRWMWPWSPALRPESAAARACPRTGGDKSRLGPTGRRLLFLFRPVAQFEF
jgi:hypothetical protein